MALWSAQEGHSSIKIYKNEDLIKEVTYEDKVGLFTREIDHASSMIIDNMLESEYVSHQDSQGNMLWLDKWRQQLDINCPFEQDKPFSDNKSKFL